MKVLSLLGSEPLKTSRTCVLMEDSFRLLRILLAKSLRDWAKTLSEVCRCGCTSVGHLIVIQIVIWFLVAIMIRLSTSTLGISLCFILFREGEFDNVIRVGRRCVWCVRGAWSGNQSLSESGKSLTNSSLLRVLDFLLTHSTVRSKSV